MLFSVRFFRSKLDVRRSTFEGEGAASPGTFDLPLPSSFLPFEVGRSTLDVQRSRAKARPPPARLTSPGESVDASRPSLRFSTGCSSKLAGAETRRRREAMLVRKALKRYN